MVPLGPQWSEDQEREYQLGQLYTRARRALRRGQLAEADNIAQAAARLAPDTTSVEELRGDVALAHKNYAEARQHFQRALEIESANADAERKLGQLAIILDDAQRLRRRVEEVAEDPSKRFRFSKQPTLAALLSVIFPGFGQLYNSQYEKGLGMFATAFTLLIVLIDRLLFSPFVTMAREAAHGGRVPVGEQMERTRDLVAGYGFLAWTLIALGILAYLALWTYSVVDAYKTCQQQAREADDLGVEL